MSDDKRLYLAYYGSGGEYSVFKANDMGLRTEALEYFAKLEAKVGQKITHIVPLHGMTTEELPQ